MAFRQFSLFQDDETRWSIEDEYETLDWTLSGPSANEIEHIYERLDWTLGHLAPRMPKEVNRETLNKKPPQMMDSLQAKKEAPHRQHDTEGDAATLCILLFLSVYVYRWCEVFRATVLAGHRYVVTTAPGRYQCSLFFLPHEKQMRTSRDKPLKISQSHAAKADVKKSS